MTAGALRISFRSTVSAVQCALVSVLVSVLLSGCFLRSSLTQAIGFRPKPMQSDRETPALWGWSSARLDTISRVDSAGGILAWWGAAPAGAAPCAGVLLLHGKGRNRAELMPLGRALQSAGYAVLIPDYRGYGGAAGEPTTSGVFADAELSYRSLRARLGDASAPMVVIGHSMGTALAARLARDHSPALTVYMSPFTRISALVRSRAGAAGLRLFDTTSFAFNPIDDASMVRGRAMVVVAGRDALISRTNSDTFIAGLTPAPTVLRDQRATHNSILTSDSTVSAVTDSVRAWVPCAVGGDADSSS